MEFVEILFEFVNVIILLLLATLGYFSGTILEKRHYRSILKREKNFLKIPAVSLEKVISPEMKVEKSDLVCGSAVISLDYFKRILAGLRKIFGGSIGAYESLIDRARREAVLRMKEQDPQADMIINIRIETFPIGQNTRRGVGSVEAIAYGTAIHLKK